MSRFLGFVALLVVMAAAAGIYVRQTQSVSGGGKPRINVDIVAVEHDLMAIARAERTHNAMHGGYGSLDELRSSGDLTMAADNRGPYVYSAAVSGSGFKVTATYNGPDNPLAPKSISIDETMKIIQE